ncbi:MAG: IS1595 family transposase [Bacillota bacterium]
MARQESLTLLDFQQRFPDEPAGERYLFEVRWPNGFCCPVGQNSRYYHISKRDLYQCTTCRYQASVTAGTVMYRTRTLLQKWFWAIYLVASDKRGCSALSLKRHLRVSYQTAWHMLHKVRHAMAARDGRYRLGGLVQLDDAFVGGPNGKQGRGTEKTPILVPVSVTPDAKPLYAKMAVVDTVNCQHAHDFLLEAVLPGSHLITDGLSVYSTLTAAGYTHERHVGSSQAQEHLHWVHTIVSNLKAFVAGTYHGLSEDHLAAYLAEFCYRFNRRARPDQLFSRLLSACTACPALTCAELTG